MLIPTANRIKILRYLFKEGVCLAKKEFFAKKNIVLPSIPNIQVIKMMQSLVTRKYVKETFNWQIYYWTLTDEGIVYLREYLHIDENVIPATLKPTKQAFTRPFDDERRARRFGDREGFRRDGYKKDSGDFKPSFKRQDDGQRRDGGYRRAEAGSRPRA
ncbi:putative 40S ribosomal protein S10-1 [Monocercomonoides exilis]|uniref:putative 40S ribosomal protein S10-1 n=1 Tax=Monocercomonoides exilis TaxID=2049356 RepID=UPI00355A0BDE|nr:putative 40S ribosomal protein S10-1 [Monocercomonoides exilis]KAH7832573.1 putative 40S ribosomal protein S10-1 [Monocercomonoides exilis]|eukprot:MONOS_180.1-p1 / transcript=MONOS_180.1 / gene=MONOS_180 / organism=Monocercomonoides_exilis_PA203 / gene_product=40S ribosomal protein S10-1 / transcript_product=40S ribosomal protein S10-1 / location=Mono_scaffold00003:147418-148039(-) / protein_length=159 / sequence_SO=supercontig / SO=protein_coding / is_pseudo=false